MQSIPIYWESDKEDGILVTLILHSLLFVSVIKYLAQYKQAGVIMLYALAKRATAA